MSYRNSGKFLKENTSIKHLINDLLDTYNNITLAELESVTTIELERAKKVIKDPYDRPIFIFAYRRIHRNIIWNKNKKYSNTNKANIKTTTYCMGA